MKHLIWLLPSWIHSFILLVTRWRLIKIQDDSGRTMYVWSKSYPFSNEDLK